MKGCVGGPGSRSHGRDASCCCPVRNTETLVIVTVNYRRYVRTIYPNFDRLPLVRMHLTELLS